MGRGFEVNTERLYKALKLASFAHEGQKRKGKNPAPYISHPVFVGMELLRLGYYEDTVMAGILHDTLEDGFPNLERSVVKDMIRNKFGDRVLNLVDAVTEPKDPNTTKEEKRRTWEPRKKAYLEQLKSASPEARAIACLDMYANMLELKQTLEEEGLDALKLFNVDMEKKFKHWQEELDLFAEDKNYPHSKIITEMKNILKDIQELIKT
jgi:(p)ppGpp synthase/HD superfamily hydrolase